MFVFNITIPQALVEARNKQMVYKKNDNMYIFFGRIASGGWEVASLPSHLPVCSLKHGTVMHLPVCSTPGMLMSSQTLKGRLTLCETC